jgi:hypothetical protein
MYPQNIGSDVRLNLLQRRVSCHYVHVLMNTAIARKETESTKKVPLTITNQSQIQAETKKKKRERANDIEKALSYSQMGKHFHEIEIAMLESRHSGRQNIISEEQYRQMLLFKTEAAVHLQQWGQEDSISE